MYKIFYLLVKFMQHLVKGSIGIGCWYGLTILLCNLFDWWGRTTPLTWLYFWLGLYAFWTLGGLFVLLWNIFQEVSSERSVVQSRLGSAVKHYHDNPVNSHSTELGNCVQESLSWFGFRGTKKLLLKLSDGRLTLRKPPIKIDEFGIKFSEELRIFLVDGCEVIRAIRM